MCWTCMVEVGLTGHGVLFFDEWSRKTELSVQAGALLPPPAPESGTLDRSFRDFWMKESVR